MRLIGIRTDDPRRDDLLADAIAEQACVLPLMAAAQRAAVEGFDDSTLAHVIASAVGRSRLRSRLVSILEAVRGCSDTVVVPDLLDADDAAMIDQLGGTVL